MPPADLKVSLESPTEPGLYLFCGLTKDHRADAVNVSAMTPRLVNVFVDGQGKLAAVGMKFARPESMDGAWIRVTELVEAVRVASTDWWVDQLALVQEFSSWETREQRVAKVAGLWSSSVPLAERVVDRVAELQRTPR